MVYSIACTDLCLRAVTTIPKTDFATRITADDGKVSVGISTHTIKHTDDLNELLHTEHTNTSYMYTILTMDKLKYNTCCTRCQGSKMLCVQEKGYTTYTVLRAQPRPMSHDQFATCPE